MRKLKQKMLYEELWDLSDVRCTVDEVLNQLVMEEGPSVTQTNLLRWAKFFDKAGKNQQALEIYEWMMRQKMTHSASQHGVHVDLIAKNHSTYRKLLKWYCRGLEEDKAKAFFHRMDLLKLVINCSPFNDLMTLYMGLGQPEKVVEIVDDMKDRDICLNYVSYGIWLMSSKGAARDHVILNLPYDDEDSCKHFRNTIAWINERGIVRSSILIIH